MLPLVEDWSDEESGDIPFNDAPEQQYDDNNTAEASGDDDDEGDEDDEVFVVDEIKDHRFDAVDGTLWFHVKWKGYPKLEDHTWEPEPNLEDVPDILKTYFDKSGGRPEKPPAKGPGRGAPGRKRKSMGEKKEASPAGSTDSKRRRRSAPKTQTKSKADPTPKTEPKNVDSTPAETDEEEPSDWVPKGKSWEKDIQSVDTIIRDADDNGLYALLHWTNGKRSRVPTASCYEKCPRAMLQFYETHLVFRNA